MMLQPMFIRAEVKEIPFTLDDRDRIIRTEQKVEALDAKIGAVDAKLGTQNFRAGETGSEIDSKTSEFSGRMNAGFNSMDKRFDDLFFYLRAIIFIFSSMTIAVVVLGIMDRLHTMRLMKQEEENFNSML